MTLRIFFFLTLFFANSAHATLMLRLSLHQLTDQSDKIFLGEVKDVASYWDRDHKFIVTATKLVVLEDVVGTKVGEELTIYSLGGKVGEKRMRALGAEEWVRGQKFVLFTQARHGGRYVVGMTQGQFPIVESPKGELALQTPKGNENGIAFVEPTGSLRAMRPLNTKVTLSEFVANVQQAKNDCVNKSNLCK